MNEVIRWLRRSRAFSTNARAHLRMLLRCSRDDYRRQQQKAMHGGTETANGKTRESSLTSGEVSTIMSVRKKMHASARRLANPHGEAALTAGSKYRSYRSFLPPRFSGLVRRAEFIDMWSFDLTAATWRRARS